MKLLCFLLVPWIDSSLGFSVENIWICEEIGNGQSSAAPWCLAGYNGHHKEVYECKLHVLDLLITSRIFFYDPWGLHLAVPVGHDV